LVLLSLGVKFTFPTTAAQTTAIMLSLKTVISTTQNWTGGLFAQVQSISKRRKLKCSKSRTKRSSHQILLFEDGRRTF
jgi:hypothetical protein